MRWAPSRGLSSRLTGMLKIPAHSLDSCLSREVGIFPGIRLALGTGTTSNSPFACPLFAHLHSTLRTGADVKECIDSGPDVNAY